MCLPIHVQKQNRILFTFYLFISSRADGKNIMWGGRKDFALREHSVGINFALREHSVGNNLHIWKIFCNFAADFNSVEFDIFKNINTCLAPKRRAPLWSGVLFLYHLVQDFADGRMGEDDLLEFGERVAVTDRKRGSGDELRTRVAYTMDA